MADLIDLGAKLELDGLTEFLRGMKRVAVATGAAAEKNAHLAAQKQRTANFFAAVTAASTATTAALHLAGSAFRAMGTGADMAMASIQKYADFDMQIARVASLLPESAGLMGELNDQVSKLAVTFGQDGATAAGAFFDAISAGVGQSDAGAFVSTASKLAVAGFTDVNTTVLGLTRTINGFRLGVEEADAVADAFFVTNKLGQTTIGELAQTLGRVAPTANAAGVSYTELLSAMAALTKGGIQTSEAVAATKQVLANVIKPTADAAKVARKLHIEFSASALKAKGLAGFIADLAAKSKGSAEAQAALFGSVEAFNAVAILASEGGARDFNEALKQMGTRAGTVEHEFSRASDRIGFKIQQIKVGLDQFAIAGGEGLVEGLGLDALASDVPETVEEIGKTVKSSAKAFGDAFRDSFTPFGDVEKVPWEQIADRMGRAAGKIGNAFYHMGMLVADAAETAVHVYDWLANFGSPSPADAAGAGRVMTAADLRAEPATSFDNPASDWLAEKLMAKKASEDGRYRKVVGAGRDAEAAAFMAELGIRDAGGASTQRGIRNARARRHDLMTASYRTLAENAANPTFYDSEDMSRAAFEPAGQTPIEITRNLTIAIPDGEGGTKTLTSTTKDAARGKGDARPMRTREARGGVTVDDELELAGPGG